MIKYVFVNGVYAAELSDATLLSENMKAELTQNGLTICISKNYVLSTPIRLVFISKENANHQNARISIIAEENSRATIIAEYFAENAEQYTTNNTTDIFTEKNATIYYYKVQNENKMATHTASITIQQKQDSCVKTFFADFGSAKAQENVRVNLAEKGASCFLHGLYYLNENKQELNNHIHVDHVAEHGNSTMLFKGIVNKKSRASFKGKVFVHHQAQGIHAQQANHNLLLSNDAQAETKPELEIYADDVKCSHGATVGQLDQDALFYLRARGMEKNAAMKLLTQAFAQDVISKIEDANLMQQIQEQVGQYE